MERKFIELVKEMRSAQKRYFKTRSYNDLTRTKQLEAEVDKYILHLSNIETTPQQNLF